MLFAVIASVKISFVSASEYLLISVTELLIRLPVFVFIHCYGYHVCSLSVYFISRDYCLKKIDVN